MKSCLNVYKPIDTVALKDIIESSGVDFKQNAISYIFRCPRCQKSNKLYVRKRDGRFTCWVCQDVSNYKGYRVDLPLSELLGGKRKEYAQQLWGADRDFISAHIDLDLEDHWGDFEDEDSFMGEPPIEIKGWDYFEHYPLNHPKAAPGVEYLLRRDLDIDLASRLDIRYSARQNRVCFPMVIDGLMYGWQGRYCGENEFIHKADTCLSIGVPGNYLMFGDTVAHFGHAILTEGPMDALKLAYCGGAVAALGKGVTEAQIRWLSEHCKKLYIGLDRDAAPEINKVMAIAQSFGMQTWLIQPPAHRKDFGDCTHDEASAAFANTCPINLSHLIMTLGKDLVAPY